MKRKSQPSPDPQSDPLLSTDVKWGKKAGEINTKPIKTYGPNPKARKITLDSERGDVRVNSLKKFTRMQIVSCLVQLEQKNYIECPMKGCRCISMSVFEIAEHIGSCEGAKSNDKLKLCKYCPHGMLTSKSLFNHVIVSHPYAVEVQVENGLEYDNSVNDEFKSKFLASDSFRQTIKSHWRVYLESKGCIMCLIPCCRYVTGFIPKMEAHFPLCGPKLWKELTYSCNKCTGRTYSEEELDAHFSDCHSSDITCNFGNEKLKEFWKSTLQAYEISKCVSKNCKFISHNIISLEKHYRYCRNPRKENFEVCAICGGWFDNTYDLWTHETQSHVIGKSNKIRKLMSIDVNHPGTPWLMKKLAARSAPISSPVRNPPSEPEPSKKIYFKDVVLKQTTFLGELAKTIESESKLIPFIDVRVTVENQFSWVTKAPDLKIATEVVSRRLPSYSVKRIMAENIEDGARLLKLSETVASITNKSEKKYIPPRPLDFVLDTPNALETLRQKFVVPKPEVPEEPSIELSVPDNSQVQDGKSTTRSVKKKVKSKKGSQKKESQSNPSAKKLKCDNNGKTRKEIKTLVPVIPKVPALGPRNTTLEVCNPKNSLAASNTVLGVKASRTNNQSHYVVVPKDADSSTKLVLDYDGTPIGPYIFANCEMRPTPQFRPVNFKNPLTGNTTSPSTRLQYPPAKGSALVEHPRLASILLQPIDKKQIPTSLKLVGRVPFRTQDDVKPMIQPHSSSFVKNPKFQSPIHATKTYLPKSGRLNEVDRANRIEDSIESSSSHSSISLKLPVLPFTESTNSAESIPISDCHHEMVSPDNKTRYLRTYGKNGYSSRTLKNGLIVKTETWSDEDDSCMDLDDGGIFTDVMGVDCKNIKTEEEDCICEGTCKLEADVEVKTEPEENEGDLNLVDSSAMFFENYDIFADCKEEALSPPYDSTVPFDVICESSQAVSGGLYNDRCPWELYKTNRSSKRKSRDHQNAYRSKKLLESCVYDPQSTTKLFGNEALGGNLDTTNQNANDEKSSSTEEFKELVNYLTNANGAHFVNEPVIYTVDKIIFDNLPKLSDLKMNKMGSKSARCFPHIPYEQNSLSAKKQGFGIAEESSSNLGCNLQKPDHYSRDEIADSDTKEFQELVNYLTHFNRGTFVNKPIVYAVDKIIYDNRPKMSAMKTNGTVSKKARRGRGSSSDILHEHTSPQSASLGQQSDSSDQPVPPSDSSESAGAAPKKSQAGQLPFSNGKEQLATSKRKRKMNSSKISKVLSDKVSSCVESDRVPAESSLCEMEGGSKVDSLEKDDVITGAGTSGQREQRHSKTSSKNSEKVELSVKAEHSEDSSVSNQTSGGRKRARKSAHAIIDTSAMCDQESTNESFTPKTIRKKHSPSKEVNVDSVVEISPGVIVPFNKSEVDSEDTKVAKRKGRPPKRPSRAVLSGRNVPKSTFKPETSNQSSTSENFLYLPGDNDPDSDVLVPADRRIIFSSYLPDPLKLVECAVCGDNMTAAVYKTEHVVKHNHLCWLKGEEPMDLEDEKGVERFLYRVYLKTRAPFVCEICNVSKKSALGFLSHRKFCGKSVQERKELMVSCTVCSRVLLPSSLHNHMIKTHPAIASIPEEPPLEGRLAASKCMYSLSAAAKDIRDSQEFIDDSEELKAVEKESWIRQVYSFCKRRVQKEQKSIIEAAAEGDKQFRCIITDCDFTDANIINVIEHYRVCDKEPLDCKCKECTFITNSETRMINHVRMTHFQKASQYASKEYKSCEIIDVTDVAGAFIPYIKSGELGSRSMLYLQPALYWTRDLREEHLSIDPVFIDWDFDSFEHLDVKTVEEFASHLHLRDESIRIKPSKDSSEWSILKRFSCERFNDDVRILYTGGIVRSFDWFPSSESQYLAVSVGSVDSENISARPVHSGPSHFQIWSTGTLDNFSEPYEADLHLYLAVCHGYGEIWDLECCPSGGLTEKRLGLVAIGTSSGIVAVYSIPLLDTSSKERAVKLDPVIILQLGTKESSQVSKISWSKTKPHRFIAAGFTNGSVAVWDLTTTSTLLKSGNTLLPFKCFHPHLTIITALSFSPVNEYYIATGCADKFSRFWNLHDTSYNHGEFTRGLVTDVTWLPNWMAALNTLDDNYTTGTTTVILNSIRNFIYQSQPAVTQADSTGTSISANNWLNTFVCGYDSGQIIQSIARKYNQHHNEDRRKVFNCLLCPQLHDFDPSSTELVGCKSYSSSCKRFGIIFNHNFHMNNQTKIKGNPCTDLSCYPLTSVNKVCWNPNPNSFLTLASGFHSGFIIVSRVKLPTMEINLLKSIVDNFNTEEPS